MYVWGGFAGTVTAIDRVNTGADDTLQGMVSDYYRRESGACRPYSGVVGREMIV